MRTTSFPQGTSTRAGLALLVALLLLFITACGGEVETTVKVDSKLKGTRTMVVSFDTDQDAIDGGTSAIDASIKKHLPQDTGLTYEGIKTQDDDAQATFVLTFSSADDYEEKVLALLKASGYSGEPKVTLTHTDSALVEGYVMEENFASTDLLYWVADGLVDDRVIEEQNRDSVFTYGGETTVQFGDKKVDSNANISANNVVDNGFRALNVSIADKQDEGYGAELQFRTDSSPGSVQEKKIDEYFKEATPDGAELKDSITSDNQYSEAYGYTLSFDAKDEDELAKKLQQALGSERNNFTIEGGASPDDKTRLRSTVKAALDCSAICSPEASEPELTFTTADSWSFVEGTSNISQDYGDGHGMSLSGQGAKFEIILERGIPLASARIQTELGLDGSVNQSQKYVLAGEHAAVAGDAFESLLEPPADVAVLSRAEEDGNTVFTLEVDGENAADFNAKISELSNGSRVSFYQGDGLQIWPEYDVAVQTPSMEGALANGVEGPIELVVSLPAMNSVKNQEQLNPAYVLDGNTVSAELNDLDLNQHDGVFVRASGPTLGGLIFLGILLSVILALVIAAVIFRKRLRTAVHGAWARRGEAAQRFKQASASAREHGRTAAESFRSTQAQIHPETGQPVAEEGAAVSPHSWSESFHESKLG